MKNTNAVPGVILWAVDPFSKDKALQIKTFKTLAALTAKSQAPIEPVAVLSPDQLRMPPAVFREGSEQFHTEAERRLAQLTKAIKHPRLLPPRLITRDLFSVHASAGALVEYARECKAELVAMGTHARSGLKRMFLGSFAETVMLHCDSPILVVNPKSPPPKKISRALFATDFSEACHEAFEKFLPTARDLGARVTLYYKFEYIIPGTLDAFTLSAAYAKYMEDDIKEKKKLADQWVAEAKKRGVSAEFQLDEKPAFVAEGILKAAKRAKAELIVVAAHSGNVTAALLGSVARRVVRISTLPTWVIHPTTPPAAEKQTSRPKGTRWQPISPLLS